MASSEPGKVNDVALTSEQDEALGKAWEHITDADIEESMQWDDEMAEEQESTK